ncbi:MAG: LysM peptidoglycan-binding domain-containing protein, partial [Pirellulaceae bacterium]
MDTLKTAVVVVLLLAVLYGVYVVLNKPEQYPQDLAWETGTPDPALQIELGTPEAGENFPAALPTATWESETQTPAPSGDAHASHVADASGSSERSHASHHELGEQPSLPIPEPTTPAAPAIAAPELLSETDSPTMEDKEVPAEDVSYVANEAEESEDVPAGIASSAERFGGSNRYSGPGSMPVEPDAASQPNDELSASATAAQANINDVAEREAPGVESNEFQSALQAVHAKIEAEDWHDALLKLSSYCNDPSLNSDEFSQLVDLLDPLAGKVIYSMEHLIEPAYQSQPGDTLVNVADRYEVPRQLLANINGIQNPESSLDGRELKVVRGPFRAEISLSRSELTLFLGKLYAGRFAVTIGDAPAPRPGQYQINDKQPGRTYYAG